MKTAMIHCYYNQYGGEDATADAERKLINPTLFFGFKNAPGIKGLFQFFLSVYNVGKAKKICKKLKENKIELVHIQNWHFVVGPYIVRALKKEKIKVVVTLQNFRILGPSGILYHKGEMITKTTTSGFPWRAVWKRFYRNSILLTFWLAFINWFHLKIKTFKKVDLFLVQTDFAKNIYLNSPLKPSPLQFKIKTNSVADPGLEVKERIDHFLFVGRLTEEKGIKIIIEAVLKAGKKLKIIGNGPLQNEIEKFCKQNPSIEYLGFKTRTEVLENLRSASCLLFPSVWYEGMPVIIIEAFATGTPVLASHLGAMASMIQHKKNGWLVEPGNVGAWTDAVSGWHSLPMPTKNKYQVSARESYEALYTPEHNRKELLSIYKSVINQNNQHLSNLLIPMKNQYNSNEFSTVAS